MNKHSTLLGVILLTAIFFNIPISSAQDYQFRPHYWNRKAQQLQLELVNGETVSGLMVFVDDEGIMLIPDAQYLTPVLNQVWNPKYFSRENIATVSQDLQFFPVPWGLAVGVSLPIVGFVHGSQQGSLDKAINSTLGGIIAGVVAGPLTYIMLRQWEKRLAVIEAQDPTQWQSLEQNAHWHTLVSPHNADAFLALKTQITPDTASWVALRDLSPVMKNMYRPSLRKWGVEASVMPHPRSPFFQANDNPNQADTRRAVNLAVTYNFTPNWRIEAGVGRWKNTESYGYYNWSSGPTNILGNVLNTHVQGDYGYLLGKWTTHLAESPMMVGLGLGAGLERVQFDLYSTTERINLVIEGETELLSSERVEDFYTSEQYLPSLITTAELGYIQPNWGIFLGYFVHGLPKLDRPAYAWEHYTFEQDPAVQQTLQVEAGKEALSRADLRLGLRFYIQ